MPQYLISFDAHTMDHIPNEEMPVVTDASLAVVQAAIDAGVCVGLRRRTGTPEGEHRGYRREGHRRPVPGGFGGLCVVDVPTREEALEWAAKVAVACRCAQEVREFMPDPTVGN